MLATEGVSVLYMHTRFSGAARALIVAATAASLAMAPVTALACTQVYMGPELTATGETIYGRSEDAANRYLKEFGIEPRTEGKTYWSGENGPDHDPDLNFTRVSPGATYRYTYVRDLPDDWDGATKAYSEAGTNECGVSVDATLTTAYNEGIEAVDPCLDNGIGEYSVTDVVLSEAATAREGVELLGSIIDEQGSQDCNQIWIGDANEVWNFQQLSGHQWIAVRMAADTASLNPNMSNLQFAADLDDNANCLHSADLVKTAEDAKTLVTNEDGSINIAKSYGLDDEGAGQDTRYVQGHKYFETGMTAGKDYTLDADGAVDTIADPQLFFTPGRTDYELFDMLRSIAARGEGTDVDANANDSLYAIGNNRTVECHIFQTRDGLDPEIATVQWEALSRGEFSVYVPSYSALLTQVDSELYPASDGFDVEHVGNENEFTRNEAGERVYDDALIAENEKLAMQGTDSKALAYVFMDLNTLAYNHRAEVADGVHAYLDALQKEIIAQQEQVDKKMQATPAGAARNALANEAHAVASKLVYERGNALLDEVRAYLQAGDFSKPFAASDLADGGSLVAPLTYASDMEAFDAEAAASSVVEPEAAPEEEAEPEEAAESEEATEEASATEGVEAQPLSGANYALFVFLAGLAALIGFGKRGDE